MADTRKPCCQDERNLRPEPTDRGPSLTMTRCIVCGCRHFELDAEVGRLGATGIAAG